MKPLLTPRYLLKEVTKAQRYMDRGMPSEATSLKKEKKGIFEREFELPGLLSMRSFSHLKKSFLFRNNLT